MLPISRTVCSVFLLLLLAGCNFFAPPAPEQTLAADHAAMSTQIVNLRATQSAAGDRLLITQEAIQTAVRDVEQQGTRIAATVLALGTPFVDTARITPNAPLASGSGLSATQVVVIPGGASQGSVVVGTPTAAAAPLAAPVNPDAPSLSNIVTAQAVNGDNCAAASVSSFTAAAAGVYTVAVGNNLTSSNVITYRWQRESIEVWVDTWSPAGNTDGQCVWYYLTPNQAALEPGAWAVEVLLDNVPQGAPVPFTITP